MIRIIIMIRHVSLFIVMITFIVWMMPVSIVSTIGTTTGSTFDPFSFRGWIDMYPYGGVVSAFSIITITTTTTNTPYRYRSISSSSSSSSSSSNSHHDMTYDNQTPIVRQRNIVSSSSSSSSLYAMISNQKETPSSSSSSFNTKYHRDQLLDLIINQTPSGKASSQQMTQQILYHIRQMNCPTTTSTTTTTTNNNNDQQEQPQILTKLNGNWELLWTAQDPTQMESQRWMNRIINPLEDQSYSNNPEGGYNNNNNYLGRSNPFLPIPVQNLLEQMGIVSTTTSSSSSLSSTDPTTTLSRRRSTQAIDIKNRIIRNIVSIQLNTPSSQFLRPWNRLFGSSSSSFSSPSQTSTTTTTKTIGRISLTVIVKFTPVPSDLRRINVKFSDCRISIPNMNIDVNFPLGLLGPTGWLRTIYIDDTIRITRGHKGSVFVLSRPRRATV